ncbi:DC_STAMP domain-containing protein [Meloidogyne graminicola]|uniref:DC_STAMP domain-containing protein n=1 Tax=Meloidogyne graminicola TaxID=189291 RepID=A0A8T0A426_9BILA|nr:DC_STAMP domain-containing protein [Meloidogyne graminicola]
MVLKKKKGIWETYQEVGLYNLIFVEPSREKKIVKEERSRFLDIFLYSGTNDYRVLRFLYNFPFGCILSKLVYEMAWYKINFAADTRFIPHIWAILVEYFLICFAALSFCFNSLIRCSIIFAILSGLSSSGQGVISIYVMENLRIGPIQNIMVNFGHSTKITLCHLELQARVVKRRMEIQAGPLELLFEKHFGNATTIGNKVVKMMNSLVQPYDGEIDPDQTEDDNHLAAIIDTAEALASRKLKSYDGDNFDNDKTKIDRISKPVLKRFKSKITKAIFSRFIKRCKLMFASSITSCHKRFEESQSLCYDTIPFPIHYLTCSAMNSLTLCKPDRFKKMSYKYCELGQSIDAARGTHESLFSSELENEMEGLHNISDVVKHQLHLNLHFIAVEAPELEKGFSVNQLKTEMIHDFEYYKIILDAFDKIFTFLIIIFTYFVFKNCVLIIMNYLNDINYKNYFTTPYFWQIDSKRKKEGKVFLNPLTKEEIKFNHIISPYGLPQSDEYRKMTKSFIRWILLLFIVFVIVMLDYYFNRMLEIVIEHGKMLSSQTSYSHLRIKIDGKGVVANLLKEILNFNYTGYLKEELTNDKCLKNSSSKPNWSFNVLYIFIPVFLILLLQVFFNFVVQRFVFLVVMGIIFPKRSKARIIHLYNKLLMARINMNKLNELKKKEELNEIKKKNKETENIVKIKKKEEKNKNNSKDK